MGRSKRAPPPYDVLFKVILVGAASVGKTALIGRQCRNAFSDRYIASLRIDFETCLLEVDGVRVKLSLWDTAGQERFAPMLRSFFRQSECALVVYDLTSAASFERVDEWAHVLDDETAHDAVRILVGNKLDLVETIDADTPTVARAMTRAAGERKARSLGSAYFETSACTGASVDALFVHVARALLQRRERLGTPVLPLQVAQPPSQTPADTPHPEQTPEKKSSCCAIS